MSGLTYKHKYLLRNLACTKNLQLIETVLSNLSYFLIMLDSPETAAKSGYLSVRHLMVTDPNSVTVESTSVCLISAVEVWTSLARTDSPLSPTAIKRFQALTILLEPLITALMITEDDLSRTSEYLSFFFDQQPGLFEEMRNVFEAIMIMRARNEMLWVRTQEECFYLMQPVWYTLMRDTIIPSTELYTRAYNHVKCIRASSTANSDNFY